ncbi:UNVERIFIED_CONTAM: hypothetical protein ACS92_07275 [Bacillus cereus]
MRNVSGDTGTQSQVVQGELGDLVVKFQQQGQWLANTTGSAQDGHFVSGGGSGGELSSSEFSKHDSPRRRGRKDKSKIFVDK